MQTKSLRETWKLRDRHIEIQTDTDTRNPIPSRRETQMEKSPKTSQRPQNVTWRQGDQLIHQKMKTVRTRSKTKSWKQRREEL